jgi:hypothetical protein
MDANEIIVCEMQSASGLQILQLLRKSVSQSRKSPHLHSDREVLPLNKTRAYMLRIGHAANRLGYNLRDWSWGVPLIPMLAVVSE